MKFAWPERNSPVLFNVAQLLQEPIGAERVYELAGQQVAGVAEEVPPSDLSGTVRLVRTNRGLLAYADLDAVARDVCSRCLGPAETPMHVTVEEEFLPSVDVHTGQPLPRAAVDDDAFLIDEHHHLDLTEAVRQTLVMEQPMRPLCREDCAGLCEHCGADLNLGNCNCPEESVDSRWAALRGLAAHERATE